MSGSYDDIIHLPHPISTRHPPMSMIDRAAQFSPFAALTGYDAVIKETARLTDHCSVPDGDAIKLLDEKIQLINELIITQPTITIEYFVPDQRKSGGACMVHTGRAAKIDPLQKSIIMTDGTSILFERILKLDSEIFGLIE